MEYEAFGQENERLATPEERAYVRSQLAARSLGFYDASQDTYTILHHPEDDVWPYNPDIIPGEK